MTFEDTPRPDVFAVDTTTAAATLVSVPLGGEGDPVSGAYFPSVSDDGSTVTYQGFHRGVTNSTQTQVWTKDLTTGDLRLVTAGANGLSQDPEVSPDGGHVVYASNANNLVAGDTNGVSDVFLEDLANGEVVLVSQADDGTLGNGNTFVGVPTNQGRSVFFQTTVTNLSPLDTDCCSEDVYRKQTSRPPDVTISSPADNATYTVGDEVEAAYTCLDDTPGVTCVGTVATGDRVDTSTPGSFSLTVTATDVDGNETTITRYYAVVTPPDTTDPAITIVTPVDGSQYSLDEVVTADFSCDDGGGSGIDTCLGTVPAGDPIDTSTLGSHTFTVDAVDLAGNTASQSVTYEVVAAADTTDPTIGSPSRWTVPPIPGRRCRLRRVLVRRRVGKWRRHVRRDRAVRRSDRHVDGRLAHVHRRRCRSRREHSEPDCHLRGGCRRRCDAAAGLDQPPG